MAFFGSVVKTAATVGGAAALVGLVFATDPVEVAKCNELHGRLGSPVPPTLPVSPTFTRSPKS